MFCGTSETLLDVSFVDMRLSGGRLCISEAEALSFCLRLVLSSVESIIDASAEVRRPPTAQCVGKQEGGAVQ
jgi:hypothetical protein